MKNILFVATQPQRFLDQVNFAKNIREKTDELNISFFISNEVYILYPSIIDNLEFKIANEIKKKLNFQNNNNSLKYILKENIKNYITIKQRQQLRRCINSLKNTKLFTYRYKKQEKVLLEDLNTKYNQISNLVKINNIDVLLINGDRHLGFEPVFLKISKELNIPSIIIYLADYADEERIFHNDVITKKIKKNILASSYIIESQNNLTYKVVRDSYYYPHPIGNALQKFGIITSNPYVMGSGVSDVLCLNNQYYKELYVKNGVDKNKIKIIGNGSYDKLYNKFIQKDILKQELNKIYELDNKKKNIIVALPQLGEHNILPWDKHWEEINFLMRSIDNLNQNILVSLHPKMQRKNYGFLEDKYNCKILDERLADILVVADVFVATFSSTVVWAILCGIKTVVIDFYGLNYTMYDFLTSIKKVDDKKLLHQNVEEILDSKVDFTQDWLSLSKDEVFDGQTTQRYIDLINEVSKN